MNNLTSAYARLTMVERQYVDDYVLQLNAAAMSAGENIAMAVNKPIPERLIEASGGVLAKPVVQIAIVERVNELSVTASASLRRAFNELCNIAFANIDDLMQVDPVSGAPIYNFNSATREQMAAVAAIDYSETAMGGRTIKVKMHSKLDALKAVITLLGGTVEGVEFLEQIKEKRNSVTHINRGENAGERYANLIS